MRICMGCMEKLDENIGVCPACGYTRGTPPKEVYHMQPESVLEGKYVVGRVLGYGGFGVTYLGWDAQLERKVAIKEYLPTDFSTRMPGETQLSVYHGEAHDQFEAGLERFVDEAQRLAKFNKLEGVVDIYDTFVENNTGYIVMQFLDGQTVKDIIKANGSIPYDTAREIIIKVLETLVDVHREGVIHRDLSPDNIFITNKNEVKLLDFGAARYATTFHSKSLSVILKPGYAPEEQYRSRGNQGSWSDIYALAATFYKMLTGITPEEAMERAIKDNVQPPSKLGVKISASEENALMNAMNVRIEERTQTAEEFLAALQSGEVKRVEPAKVRQDTGKVPLGLKIAAGVVSAAIITVGVLSGVGVIKWTPGDFLTFGMFVSEQVNAPGVINKMLEEAKNATNDIAQLQITNSEFSDKVPKDKIMSQNPLPGRLMDKGGDIEVVVSNGSEADWIAAQEAAAALNKASVPPVVSKPEADARADLEAAGLVAAVAEYREDENVAYGCVISQSIAAYTAVDKGTTVRLVISKGRKDAPPPKQTNAADQNKKQDTPPSTSTPPETKTYEAPKTEEPVKETKPAEAPKAPATVHASGVSISQGSATMTPGQSISLSATVQPGDAANKSVTWSSSNPAVASVSGGRVTAQSPGKTRITVKTADGGFTASCDVTVNAVDVNNL